MEIKVAIISSGFSNISDNLVFFTPDCEEKVLRWCGEGIVYTATVDVPGDFEVITEWGAPFAVDGRGRRLKGYVNWCNIERAQIELCIPSDTEEEEYYYKTYNVRIR